MEKKEFQLTFVVSNRIVFEVNYRTLASNAAPYFATSAGQFNRERTDFTRCGQAQESLLRDKALAFYHKWDKLHLKDLTDTQYSDLIADIEALKARYPYYVETKGSDIRFNEEAEMEHRYRNHEGRA